MESNSTRDRMYRIRTEALDWLDVDGDVIALDGDRSVYLSTNKSGAELWLALAKGATRLELAEQLIRSYGIDRKRALVDVDAFLAMAAEQGLLDNGD